MSFSVLVEIVTVKMTSTLLAVVIATALLGPLSQSRLVIKPINKCEWTFFNSISMNCSSDLGSNAIIWYFTLFETSNNETVAVGATITSNYSNIFRIEQPNTTDSNLVMFDTSDLTAGTYTCSDGTEVASAQFNALYDTIPTGNISYPYNLSNGDGFWFSCSVCYYGNSFIIPQLSVHTDFPAFVYKFTNPQIEKIGSLKCATVTVIGTATCGVLFLSSEYNTYCSEPRGILPNGSATNAPSFGASSPLFYPIIVSCIPTEKDMTITGLIPENFALYGADLVCNVVLGTPVTYVWIDDTYGNTSIGHRLGVWHSGTYRCEASTEVNGTTYSASKTLFNITVIKLSFSASPKFGPMAGGTNVTILIGHWSEQITNVSNVYLGNAVAANIVKSDRENEVLVAMTPSAATNLLHQLLQITIEFTSGSFNVTTDQYFEYRSNPEITGIDPNNFIATGGTSVHVFGNDLSSVANPQIKLTVVIQRSNSAEDFTNTTIDSCSVPDVNGTEMLCIMPPVPLPQDFLDILDMNYSKPNNGRSPSKEDLNANVLVIIGSNGIDRATVYLGFILDGFQEYQNINNKLPDTRINVNSPPQINSSHDVFEYNAETKEVFQIKGRYLTRGCQLSDYIVRVGSDICQNVDLTDNVLNCRLPTEKPMLTTNDTIECEHDFSVRVQLGYKIYQYSCMEFKYSTRTTAIIIGVCVGGGVLVLLIITIIGVACYRRRKSRKQPDNSAYTTSTDRTRDKDSDDQLPHELPNYASRIDDNYLPPVESVL